MILHSAGVCVLLQVRSGSASGEYWAKAREEKVLSVWMARRITGSIVRQWVTLSGWLHLCGLRSLSAHPSAPTLRDSQDRILGKHLLSLFAIKVSRNFGTFYYLTWNVNIHKDVFIVTSFLQLPPARPVQAKRHFGFHHDLSTTLTIHAGLWLDTAVPSFHARLTHNIVL